MSKRRQRWLIAIAAVVALTTAAVFIAASVLAKRFQPLIRDQAIQYLSKRFDSDVELAALRIHMPKLSIPELVMKRGRGTRVKVEGERVVLRMRNSGGAPPLFAMRKFSFEIDLGILTDERKTVDVVTVEGLRINVPPKGARPDLGRVSDSKGGSKTNVVIRDVFMRDTLLVLLPKDSRKIPLTFDIARLHLTSAGIDVPMKYDAALTIPKPPGDVRSTGSFGPWLAEEPENTALNGTYAFTNADLGVFTGISGKLASTGSFEGTLSAINAHGEASVPDFRLKIAGNAVPLQTRFEALIDGGNGDTVLKPVNARLGSTAFTTAGTVIRREDVGRRAIALNVSMPDGHLRDLLRLAMKGTPFMEGRITLKTRIDIPPLTGKVREKLRLDGRFEVRDGKFLRSKIQEQIDQLSRRGQGQPKNVEIDEVVSLMRGSFLLQDQVLTFRSLTFGVPGADIDLVGTVDLDREQLDLHGALKLRAKVSQTMSGWKRWALKPVDPFFAKNGAGTFLRIKVAGTTKQPAFGLDRGRKGEDTAKSR